MRLIPATIVWITLSVLGLTLLVIQTASPPETAQAGGVVFTVTRTDDPAPNACIPADCSLREAIIGANAIPGPDTIDIPAGSYDLTIAGAAEDAAATGDLDITDDLTITGAGEAVTIIDGNSLDRIFHLLGDISVQISGLTVQNGLVMDADNLRTGSGLFNVDGQATISDSTFFHNDAGALPGAGGAVTNSGVMTLNNVTVASNSAGPGNADGGGVVNRNTGHMTINNSTVIDNEADRAGGIRTGNGATTVINDSIVVGNRALTGDGGGISSTQGSATTVTRTVVTGNTALGDGGGIYNTQSAVLTVVDSTISDNSAGNVGGGIQNNGIESTVSISTSTISGNEATNGGGVHHEGDATVSIANSTISGNSALDFGGGVNSHDAGSITINSTTITDNTADSDANSTGDGGGIAVTAVTVTMGNTILAGNHDPTSDPDCFGTIISGGYDLIGLVSPGCSFAGDPNGIITGQDPLLGPLSNNGGPTKTHALLEGSPAIDSGDDANCPSFDQRGQPRPQGDGCDIGAYESTPPETPTPTPTPSPTPTPTPTPTPSPTPTPTAPPTTARLWGDGDCNDLVNLGDAIGIARHLVSLSVNQEAGCPALGSDVTVDNEARTWQDINCSGGVSLGDAIGIARFLVSLNVTKPEGCPDLGDTVQVE